LIGAETGIKTIAAVHSQCRSWVISGCWLTSPFLFSGIVVRRFGATMELGRSMMTPAPFTILDVGCGPGRDLKVFSELGHIAVGLEGAAHFAVMARTYSGCEVWQQDFLKLDLPDNHFDGVYANARRSN
jgi:SAM-dependent methyltransferase